ncbi:hypothetical protein Rhopal_007818-T1 [Rhodotorula paludigena]|uniref:CAP-Gly domain-containing protein n=1 Tax=Rhodotorula paludigena TaxID=86838 RepID=A0AAV5GYV7_9BASI|nr:hypothetical protein Rhopal_007818-T1 [Rhodotorula paludigena]
MSAVLSLGTRVQVTAGAGYVRFVGQTAFAAGKWVGVELDEPGGKNDGSVAGQRYFACAEGHGVFVRASMVTVLDEAGDTEAAPSPSPSNAEPEFKHFSSPLTLHHPSAVDCECSPAQPSRLFRDWTASVILDARCSPTILRCVEHNLCSSGRLVPPTPRTTGLSRPSPSPASSTSSVPKAAPTNFAPPAPSPAPAPTPRTSRIAAARAGASARSGIAGPAPGTAPGLKSPTLRATGAGAGMVHQLSASNASSVGSLSGAGARAGSAASARRAGVVSPPAPPDVPSGDEDGEDEAAREQEHEESAVNRPLASVRSGALAREDENDPFSLRGTDARRAVEATVPQRLYDELAAKLSIVERRRAEDRDKLRELDRLREEADEWNRVREKTKARVVELVGEVKELKRENKDLSSDRDAVQSKFDDLQEQVEHSLLDKEIAESELEEAQARVLELEGRIGELEVEVEVVKEENARLEGAGDAEIARVAEGGNEGASAPSSLAYRQLEKQNARLKDALLRLRDLTTETEAEHKRKIESLEKELDLSADLQADLDNMAVELDAAESKIEDLKAQLDVAGEAQDMLEELTERNMKLHDDNEILKADVEELEALRELADELEESHLETEKQLQEELDVKDLQLQELRRRSDSLEDSCVDYEGTIGQFRELVISLQGDLEQLREHQATQATESQSLTSQSQAMLNLNLKLQSSVLKSQVKAIDLELRKLEAKQAAEHLAIVKPYLLPSFFESDADAVEALLFFERVTYKVELLNSFIEQNHSVSEALDGVVPEELVGICETRAKLGHFAALNRRFAAHLQRCQPDTFLKMGRVYREVAPIERRIDVFIEALRREELREADCGKEVDGFIAQAEHLAETHLADLDPTLDLAERETAFVHSLDLDFDTVAAAAGFAKQTVAGVSRDPEVQVDLGDGDLDDAIFKPLQNLVNHARNAKVLTKKLLRRFDDLNATSSALSVDHAQGFETLAYNSSAIAGAMLKLASDVQHYVVEVRSTKQPLELPTLLAIAKEIAAVELGKQSPRPLEEVNALLVQLTQNIGTTLKTAMEPEHVVKLSFDAPWLARVTQLQSSAAINVDAERKVVQLNEEMRDMLRDLRAKDQAHQEATVKIELMEKRLEGVKKQAEAMTELEGELAKSRKQERTYEEANEVLQRDLDKMEQELDKLRQVAATAEKQGPTSASHADPSVYEGNMETSYLIEQLTSLRSAVRFLRSENAYIKSQDLLSDLDTLPTYELPPTPPLTPEPPEPAEPAPDFSGPSTRRPPSALAAESFATRSKRLLREARLVSATPRLVDVSRAALVPEDGRKPWQRVQRDPRSQLWAERERARALERKVQQLWEERALAGRI